MKKYIKIILLTTASLALTRCDMLDPTQGTENPNLTFESILGTPASTTRWIKGQERQMTIVYNALVTILEIGSDNYDNTNTFYNQNFDQLSFDFKDADVNTLQFSIADLRQSAIVGLEKIIPADNSATPAQRAEILFYKGWAELLAGEIFVALPNQAGGAPLLPAQNIDAAIADFIEAENLNNSSISYKLALARAYYDKGDKARAVAKATEAVALSSALPAAFTRTVRYDGVNTVTNTMENALYDRGTFDDLQPLPTLDFLDPKYYSRSLTQESSIYIQKIEEAYLIIAEAQLSDNNLPGAKTSLADVLTVVNARPKETFSDLAEGRTEKAVGSRPNKNTVQVRASETDPYRSGLVLTRNSGTITISIVSGTSVDNGMITATATTDEALELLYLMRQEIFIAEGRRFADLGLRLPVSEVEKLLNTTVTAEHITGFKPTFVPADMDAITYDAVTGLCTIKYNMSKVLVQNKTSPLVLPFN
jgi:tetratricopeptide (TPR) repeat protein